MNTLIPKEQIDSIHKSIADLRSINDDKNIAHDEDPLWQEKMLKLNNHIDSLDAKAKQVIAGSFDVKRLKTVGSEVRSNKKHLMEYLRKSASLGMSGPSVDGGLRLQVSSASNSSYNGGDPQDLVDGIFQAMRTSSFMRSLCSSVTVSGDSLDVPMSVGDVTAEWSDGTSVASVSSVFVSNKIKTFSLTAQPKVTQKMIDDSMIDIESWLKDQLVTLFSLREEDAFLNGDGKTAPKGILSYEDAVSGSVGIKRVKSAAAGKVTEEDIMSLYYSLPENYSGGASFLMNKSTVHLIRTFKDKTTGQYYWMPGMMFGKADTLLGMPLYTSGYVPSVVSNKDVVLYGDFARTYMIVDRSDISFQYDPFTARPYVIIYTTKGVGGDVVNPLAMNVLTVKQ